jgi:hypothetical protein
MRSLSLTVDASTTIAPYWNAVVSRNGKQEIDQTFHPHVPAISKLSTMAILSKIQTDGLQLLPQHSLNQQPQKTKADRTTRPAIPLLHDVSTST